MIRTFLISPAIVLLFMMAAFAGDSDDQPLTVDNDLGRLRKELQQLQTQRLNNRTDMESEQRDMAAYRDRQGKRVTAIRAETDSLKRETIRYQGRGDSLASLIQSAQITKREVELSTEAFRTRLASSCDVLDTLATGIPPLSQGQIRSSIALVKNDLSSKTIENVEAFNRLVQIVSLMRDACASIQTSEGSSPVPDIRGTVIRLRIGCIMDAVADPKGAACYVWAGNNPDGTPRWKAAGDKSIAAEIVHGAAVREGKALPALISLPLVAAQNGVAP